MYATDAGDRRPMPDPMPQAAAVPLRDGRVCLVTSRNGRRWVVPKGGIEAGQTPADAAAAEAWEEAGVRGVVRPDPVGAFRYTKLGRKRDVTVFVLDVTDVYDAWPEKYERTREWVPVETAADWVTEDELRAILQSVAADAGVNEPLMNADRQNR